MDNDEELNKGPLLPQTPSGLENNGNNNENNIRSASRTKRQRNNQSGNETDYINLLQQQLSEEKHSSKILRVQLSEMRGQIAKLSETITELLLNPSQFQRLQKFQSIERNNSRLSSLLHEHTRN